MEDAEEVWKSWNSSWWISRWRGKLGLKTQPLVKWWKLSPGRESKFRIGSGTREREKLEDKLPTQSRNWEWDNRDLENKGWKHSEPLQGKQELAIRDQVPKNKQNGIKKRIDKKIIK
jgi:hypothetical protein